jgi:hypothetical protein
MQTMDFGFKPDQVLNLVIDTTEIGMNDAQARDLANNINASSSDSPAWMRSATPTRFLMGYFNNGSDTALIDGEPGSGRSLSILRRLLHRLAGVLPCDGHSALCGAARLRLRTTNTAAMWPSSASPRPKSTGPARTPSAAPSACPSEKNRKLEVVGIVRDAEFQIFGGGKTQALLAICPTLSTWPGTA